MMKFIWLSLVAITSGMQAATFVDYTEDQYMMNAPQEWQDKAEAAAQRMDYDGPYQVLAPKKAGLAINPWNAFVGGGINPLNQIPLISINPEWLSRLSEKEQNTWLDIHITRMIIGNNQKNPLYVLGGYAIFTWIIILTLFFFLRRRYAARAWWKNLLLAIFAVTAVNTVVGAKIQNYIVQKLNERHNLCVNKYAIEHGTDKDVLISNLLNLEAIIKQEVEQGQLFFKPFLGIFEKQAKQLQADAEQTK